MHLVSLALTAAALPFVFAYDWTVGVGKDETTGRKGLGFDPSVIHPAAGDTIIFEFRSGVHSAIQSSFSAPCASNGGFNSGVHTVADSIAVDAPGLPTARVIVNSTDPLWFFDEAGGLCHQGAVFAVNPTLDQTPAQFKVNAASASATIPDTTANTSGGGSSATSGGSAPAATSPPAKSSGDAKWSRLTPVALVMMMGAAAVGNLGF